MPRVGKVDVRLLVERFEHGTAARFSPAAMWPVTTRGMQGLPPEKTKPASRLCFGRRFGLRHGINPQRPLDLRNLFQAALGCLRMDGGHNLRPFFAGLDHALTAVSDNASSPRGSNCVDLT